MLTGELQVRLVRKDSGDRVDGRRSGCRDQVSCRCLLEHLDWIDEHDGG